MRPLGAWYARYVGGPLPGLWCPTAMLSVTRDAIQRRPPELYAALRDQVVTLCGGLLRVETTSSQPECCLPLLLPLTTLRCPRHPPPRDPQMASCSNCELAHYLERTWAAVFAPPPNGSAPLTCNAWGKGRLRVRP